MLLLSPLGGMLYDIETGLKDALGDCEGNGGGTTKPPTLPPPAPPTLLEDPGLSGDMRFGGLMGCNTDR